MAIKNPHMLKQIQDIMDRDTHDSDTTYREMAGRVANKVFLFLIDEGEIDECYLPE